MDVLVRSAESSDYGDLPSAARELLRDKEVKQVRAAGR
jgi:hypothetical protein